MIQAHVFQIKMNGVIQFYLYLGWGGRREGPICYKIKQIYLNGEIWFSLFIHT